jgi:hypothetical protein
MTHYRQTANASPGVASTPPSEWRNLPPKPDQGQSQGVGRSENGQTEEKNLPTPATPERLQREEA